MKSKIISKEELLSGGASPVDDTISELIDAEEKGTSKTKKVREYLKRIKIALQYLFSRYNTTLLGDNLGKYSHKMMKIISNINEGCNLEKNASGRKINGVWNNQSKKWVYNLEDSIVSINSKESNPAPTKISKSKGPVFIYSFFKSVEGAEILSYALYASGYVAVSESGSVVSLIEAFKWNIR